MMIAARLRLPPGAVDLSALDPGTQPGFEGAKSAGEIALPDLQPELADLQLKLYAEGYTGGRRSVVLVLQGMDTAGKGGVVRAVVGMLDPTALHTTSFREPTAEEREHDFLWRIERELPRPGVLGIFDRSHYEDVLVAKVRHLADEQEIERRYDAINEFEQRLVAAGTVVIKCMLHISIEEQRRRLLARLDDVTKQWKFKPTDVDERALWDDYQHAYEIALSRCNTEFAPWYVIPSDKKWYRNWAVGTILLERLQNMAPDWPKPSYDVAEQRARLNPHKAH